jgi:hypothetical protein
MMKSLTGVIMTITCLIGLFMVVGVHGQQRGVLEAPVQEPNALIPETQKPEAFKPADANAQDEAAKALRNPFRYRIPESGFVPAINQAKRGIVPSGIELLAIMVVRDQKPMAVLQVQGITTVFFVQEGDSISYERKVSAKESQLIHLRIDTITSQQVIVHPEDNLQNKRVLR